MLSLISKVWSYTHLLFVINFNSNSNSSTELLEGIQQYRITHLNIVPPVALAFAKHPLVDKYPCYIFGFGFCSLFFCFLFLVFFVFVLCFLFFVFLLFLLFLTDKNYQDPTNRRFSLSLPKRKAFFFLFFFIFVLFVFICYICYIYFLFFYFLFLS
jgi:hypothetical protein